MVSVKIVNSGRIAHGIKLRCQFALVLVKVKPRVNHSISLYHTRMSAEPMSLITQHSRIKLLAETAIGCSVCIISFIRNEPTAIGLRALFAFTIGEPGRLCL